MTSDGINSELSASYVKADTFVPLKTVGKSEMELKNKLLEIKGIKIIDADERIYPHGVSTSQLVGYIQPINAEELKEKAKMGILRVVKLEIWIRTCLREYFKSSKRFRNLHRRCKWK